MSKLLTNQAAPPNTSTINDKSKLLQAPPAAAAGSRFAAALAGAVSDDSGEFEMRTVVNQFFFKFIINVVSFYC